jgi:glucose/arabinose dehydrogenase
MRPLFLAILGLAACAATVARADFLEVSGPGERPFLVARTGDWSWEDLRAGGLTGITYSVHRSASADGRFQPLADGLLAPAWPGDPERPSVVGERVFHYLVTANDGTTDDSPGAGSEGTPRRIDLPARCSDGAAPLAEPVPLRLERLPDSFGAPTYLTHAPGRPDDLFVVDRFGRVRIRRAGSFLSRDFLDVTDRVRTGSERGLLGLAFHPDFATNGRLYVHYSSSVITSCPPLDGDHCGVVSEFTLGANPDVVDPATERLLLVVGQPYGNHDGGWIDFGPDGRLHVALGDGGLGGDPEETGQDPTLLLGSLLRIDVEPDPVAGTEYSIPPDNPFVGHPTNRPEIWAFGLRNPWRSSFDRATGDLYVADVGQDQWEEVNVAPTSEGRGRGLNFGWDVVEGSRCFEPAVGCDTTGLTMPDVEYPHQAGGCSGSVTGGYVYRGCRMPFLRGTYFFADYCLGRISSFVWDGAAATDLRLERADLAGPSFVVSFGEDAGGELYVLQADGVAWRLVPDF